MATKADKKRKLDATPEKKSTKVVRSSAEFSTAASTSLDSVSAAWANGASEDQPVFPRGSTAIPVKYDNLVSRVDVISFFYPTRDDLVDPEIILKQPKWSLRRDLFIWGIAQMSQKQYSNDPWSFYQIGGIHGLPYQNYDGDNSTEWWDALRKNQKNLWWGGYCHHGDVLFPTWHRPYVLLFEHAVIEGAKSFVLQQNLSTEDQAAALKVCEELRLPYLDWAGSYVRTNGLPDIFTSDEVTVNWPEPNTKFNNPLKSFTLPEDVGKVILSGAQFNPFAKPDYVPPPQGATPFTPKGFGTVRYPDNRYKSNYDSTQTNLMRGSNLCLRPQVSNMFGIADWGRFSNHSETKAGSEIVDNGESSSYGTFSSIEVVHDMVHDFLGGAGGHMSYPDVAGLDPIFFFHHCNVDRLIALWQYCYDNGAPEAWLPLTDAESQYESAGTFYEVPADKLSQNTPLKPFSKKTGPDTFDWFTSKDVRNVEQDMNVTYPELVLAKEKGWKPADMLNYVLQLYKPMDDTKMRWFVNLSGIPKMEYQGAYSIRVFLNLPTASAATPLTDIHYAGNIYVFARGKSVKCINCTDDSKIRGSVDATTAMLALGYVTYPEISANLSTNPDLNVSISEKDINLVYVSSDGRTQLPPPENPPTIVITWQLSLGNYIVEDPSAAESITTSSVSIDAVKPKSVAASLKASTNVRTTAATTTGKGKKAATAPWGVQGVHWGLIAKKQL